MTNRITKNPAQYGGQACIHGMRIRVRDVIDMLASGAKDQEILDDYPDLEIEDVRACFEYSQEQC